MMDDAFDFDVPKYSETIKDIVDMILIIYMILSVFSEVILRSSSIYTSIYGVLI